MFSFRTAEHDSMCDRDSERQCVCDAVLVRAGMIEKPVLPLSAGFEFDYFPDGLFKWDWFCLCYFMYE